MLGLIFLLQALTIVVAGPPAAPEYLPVRVAEATGMFSRQGLAVSLRTARSEVGAAEALAQGQAAVVATTVEALMRFGPRNTAHAPRLIWGLTAAPPVAILASTHSPGTITSVRELAGRQLGVVSPGGSERAWLEAVLVRAEVAPATVQITSVGTRRLAAGLESGSLPAGVIGEPWASRLLAGGHARLLADLRRPDEALRALGVPTVSAALFVRADRRPTAAVLRGVTQGLAEALELLAGPEVEVAIDQLPRSVVGDAVDFRAKLEALRSTYLPGGVVAVARVRETADLVRAHLTVATTVPFPRPEDLLLLAPRP